MGGRRFDDVVGNRFAVVTTVTPSQAQRREVDKLGGTLVATSPDEALGAWLTEHGALAAVVRPDRTVQHASHHLAAAFAGLPDFTKVVGQSRRIDARADITGTVRRLESST